MKECIIFFISACVLILFVAGMSSRSNREDYYLADYDKLENCDCARLYLKNEYS